MLVFAIIGVSNIMPGTSDKASLFVKAIVETGYLWVFFGIYKVITGFLMLVPKTGPLAIIMAAPYTANILPYVIFVEKNFIGLGIVVFLVNCYLIYAYFDRYKSIIA